MTITFGRLSACLGSVSRLRSLNWFIAAGSAAARRWPRPRRRPRRPASGSSVCSARGEVGQHVVGRVLPGRRAGRCRPAPGRSPGAQRGDDRAHAVVPAVAAARRPASGAPNGQVELVVDDQDLGRARPSRSRATPRHRLAAEVHELHGLAAAGRARPAERDLARARRRTWPRGGGRAGAAEPARRPPGTRGCGGCPAYLAARIAEPDHQPHGGLRACTAGYLPFFSLLLAAAAARAFLPPAAGAPRPRAGAAAAAAAAPSAGSRALDRSRRGGLFDLLGAAARRPTPGRPWRRAARARPSAASGR